MVPHYDVHWYLISEEERALMTCETGNYGPVSFTILCISYEHILCAYLVYLLLLIPILTLTYMSCDVISF